MSTLKVTNIQATGETASRAVSGVAAAWVNYDGYNTNTIGDSVNVASVTDNATGDFTFNFNNNMSNVNYSYVGSASQEASGTSTSQDSFQLKDNGSYKATSSIRGETTYVSSAASRTNYDMAEVNVLIHGDLA